MGDGGLDVRGGPGGVAATTEAIHACGDQLIEVSADLAGLLPRVAGIGLHPGLGVTGALDPWGAARVHAGLVAALAGNDGLAPCGARTGVLGGRAHVAAEAYAVAELEAEQVLSAVWRHTAAAVLEGAGPALVPMVGWVALGSLVAVGGWVAFRSLPVLWDLATVVADETADGDLTWQLAVASLVVAQARVGQRIGSDAWAVGLDMQEWLAGNPWAARELVATVPLVLAALAPTGLDEALEVVPVHVGGATIDSVPDTAPELVALVAGVGLASGALRQGDVRVAPAGPATTTTAPLSIRSAVDRLVPLTPSRDRAMGSGYRPGEIRLDRLQGPTGVRWQLYLPPTQTWSVDGGPLPADGTSNLAAVGGLESDAMEAAVEVLRAAGVQADEPVLAVGYSQGGIVAAALASDPAVQDEFAVRQVLTVGSPVSGFELPPDVMALSIEHEADLVPHLDGDPNPDRAHWTTVSRDVLDPGHGAHDLTSYLATAVLVDASEHASITSWRAVLVGPEGGAGEEVTTQLWVTKRGR